MEPSEQEPEPTVRRTIIHCCEFCTYWEGAGQSPVPLLAKCNHSFWSCEQDSRFRCHYFEERKPR